MMTINEFITSGLVGCYEPLNIFDIREDGYIFDKPKAAFEVDKIYKDLDVLRISAGSDDTSSFLILDVDRYQMSIADLMAQEVNDLYE